MGAKIDMTGWVMKEHGVPDSRLTVLYELPERKNKRPVWHCKCECGNECNVPGSNLRSGNTKSCGCLHNEITRENNKQKIKIIPKGTRFGKLIVIKLLDERYIRKDGKGTELIYQCQCDCGKIVNVLRNNLISYHALSCGCSKISRGEFLIEQLLIQNKIFYENQKIFKDCLFPDTNYHAYFDFYINNKYVIEYDGRQHFQPVKFNNMSEEKAQSLLKYTQEHDKFKNQYCFEHNIPIIRIPYTHLNKICLEDLKLETSKFLLKQEE